MSSPTRLILSEAQRRVVQHLRIHGPTARVHLAQTLGINPATLTRITQQLADMQLVEDIPTNSETGRGRPTIPVAIAGDGGWSVGATVHPGWLELVAIDFRGEILFEDTLPFTQNDPRVFARTVEARLRTLVAQRSFMRGRFLGLGVAVAGYAIDGDRNRRAVVDWIAPWDNIPLREVLGDVLGMPVWIENDAAAAALAEFYRPEIIRQHRSILVFFLGHGVGGGLIALYLAGLDFSISAAIGFISLFGVAVMDGILNITYFRELRASGMSIAEAVFNGAEQRMRPMLMTALSAGVGLFPAALSHGIGSQVQRPLATVVVGGMFIGPLLLLIVAPALRKIFLSRERVASPDETAAAAPPEAAH